ncbi:MAG: hypothetical protein KKB51_12230 [Candidatus Riflebacteria bacterium]|nr:hypothetical protein [Candidatus Riflebacteria bacterium]
MNFSASNVAAARQNHADDVGQGIVPLAVPHGEVFDLSRSSYAARLFGEGEGFQENGEYILKLGSGGGNVKYVPLEPQDPEDPEPPDQRMIYIPMNNQSDINYLRAYGVVYSSLRSSAEDTEDRLIYWLLNHAGGAFMINYTETRKAKLDSFGIIHQILIDPNDIQGYLNLGNPSLDLYAQRKIAVYSNSATTAATAQTLTDAGIPFATINDAAILSGTLANYHLVFMAPEDMTGYSGGCSHIGIPCQNFFLSGALGTIGNAHQRATTALFMCTQCQKYYDSEHNDFDARAAAECLFKGTRCCKKVSGAAKEKTWGETKTTGGTVSLVYPGLVCGTSTAKLCYDFIMKSKALGEIAPFTVTPYAVQKQKWDVAARIKDHVTAGGYIFGQGFAAETFDLALWQKGINEATTPYEYCMAFEGMVFKDFPAHYTNVCYSNINSIDDLANQSFELRAFSDPRCQNHTDIISTGIAETNVFRTQVFASSSLVLGDKNNGDAKYIKGSFGYGEFCHLGGSIGTSVAAKRLLLNNVLYADTCEKTVASGNIPPIAGRQKSNYGPLDPDNYVGGGANDYRDRFMAGFNQPMQINDRLISESGNQRGPTDQAVDFRLFGDDEFPPSRRIIIPITDVPPEVAVNNPQNVNAKTIYDLQGNDNPDGTYSPDNYNFGSAVRVIGFAEFEISDPATFDDEGPLGPYQPGQVRGKFIRYIIKPGEVELK